MDLKKMIKQTMPARKRIIVSSIFIFFVLIVKYHLEFQTDQIGQENTCQ